MSSFKTSVKNFLFKISASNPSLVSSYYRLTYRPKRGTLAELLDLYSRTHRPVRFIQVGANDGFYHDPLYKFIRMYDWQGVMLEPQPTVFRNYLTKLHARSPGITPVNAALAPNDGESTIYRIAFSELRWATGLTSFQKDTLEKAIDSGHVARLAARYGETLPKSRDEFIKEEKVRCVSVDTLMKEHGMKEVDWVQIDAEGFDYEIVKLLDVGKNAPKVIVYERSHLSGEDQSACLKLLADNEYSTADFGENTVAMKRPLGAFERFFRKTV